MLPAGALAGKPRKVPFQRGVTVGEWGLSAYAPEPTKRKLRRLARGTNNDSVTLFTVWEMDNRNSNTIEPGPATGRPRNLIEAIKLAKKRHESVILRPYIDVVGGAWRGVIQPSDVNAWFASYRKFILYYAKIAQKYKVDGFAVESELNTMEKYTSQWIQVIKAVRKHYNKGFLMAQSNWDAYRAVRFWNKLDVIGIAAYFPVIGAYYGYTCPTGYSFDDLVTGWQQRWYPEIRAIHRKFRRPVLFSELGYTPAPNSPCQPWTTTLPGSSPADQAMAYRAALKVWYHVPWFRGFSFWYVPDQPALVRHTTSGSHIPTKPARKVLKHWYRKRR